MIAGQSLHGPAVPYGRAGSGLTAQGLGLMLVWITLATSAFVFSEPAPYDALMLGLVVLLPLLGLTSFSTGAFLFLLVWLVIGACGLAASARSSVMDISIKHMLISFYLSMSAIVIAAFIRRNPDRHVGLVVSGLVFTSLLAATAGIAGYFSLLPGAQDLFTKFGRASSTFKDPNVFGAFLVPALVYFVHRMALAPPGRSLLRIVPTGLICLALLVSFSRGAWFNAVIALLTYAYVAFIAARTNRFRLKLGIIVIFGIAGAALGLAAVMQIDSIANLIGERASLALGYDTGPEGRFGGQLKAFGVVAANPFGIGALEFGRSYHGEDVHNVYLSMFLNAGWAGGFLYLGLVFMTLIAGFRLSLRPCQTQGMTIVMLAAFAGLAAEGMIVDTDHWRHFFIVLGILWGLVFANDVQARMNLSGYVKPGRI